jgi:hypothetical protein
VTAGAARRGLGPAIAGAAVIVAYLVVAILTPTVTGRRARPLFDSFGPSAPYRWVNPPREFAASNVAPHPTSVTRDVLLGPAGSDNAGPQTDDLQAIISLVQGAIPPHDGDTKVLVTFDALDPGTLGPLPDSEKADGNAYRITAKYSSSGTPIPKVQKAGNVALESALGADGILFSADDGKTWKPIETFAIGNGTRVAAVFTDFGIYLPARSPNAPKPVVNTSVPAKRGGGSSGPVIAIVVIGGSVVAIGVAVFLVRRRR